MIVVWVTNKSNFWVNFVFIAHLFTNVLRILLGVSEVKSV